MAGHVFAKVELERILGEVVGKTLGEVDRNKIFDRAKKMDKITGIAGDVIEQSVLGYPADSSSTPDLKVDGVDVELKTTGIRKPKKKSAHSFEAKEPMSITGVSPTNILKEDFYNSRFWHKLEYMLLVYYHYDSLTTVKAIDYSSFPIEGYHFHSFSSEETEILKNDWTIVYNFIKELHENYDHPRDQYPRISSELRKDLMMIDTSPKWPNPPRFRLKRSTVTNIVQQYFGEKLEKLDESYTSFIELDNKLHSLSTLYRNRSIREIMTMLDMPIANDGEGPVAKSISEQIVVRMFGGKSKKITKLDLFQKIGLVPKTITLNTSGKRKEDMKLFSIDFNEWTNENINFEESFIFSYFNTLQFLCIIFENQGEESSSLDNIFLGFKRLLLPEELILTEIKDVWLKVRNLINLDKLVETIDTDKSGNIVLTPTTRIPRTSLNFPKSSEHLVFLRGSGSDASNKPLRINGIDMYRQNLWIRGKDIADMLATTEYI